MAEYGAAPGPVKKWLVHSPAYLYKWRLGRVFGERFLMIEHRGRKSGTPYTTVLEVAGRTDAGEYVSTAGRGPRSDWYRNLQANGVDAVWIGSKRHEAELRFLDAQESAQIFEIYEAKYPKTAAKLMAVMDVSHDGSDSSRQAMAEKVPMVAFSLSAEG